MGKSLCCCSMVPKNCRCCCCYLGRRRRRENDLRDEHWQDMEEGEEEGGSWGGSRVRERRWVLEGLDVNDIPSCCCRQGQRWWTGGRETVMRSLETIITNNQDSANRNHLKSLTLAIFYDWFFRVNILSSIFYSRMFWMKLNQMWQVKVIPILRLFMQKIDLS